MRYTAIRLLILSLICFVASITGQAQEKITADNVSELEFGYALPGSCLEFSANNQYIATASGGIYEVATGVLLFANQTHVKFSSDSELFADEATGNVINLETEAVEFTTVANRSNFVQDDQYLVVDADGVYDVATGEKLYSIAGRARFSPTLDYLLVDGTGVLELATGDVVLPSDTDMGNAIFSQDDAYIFLVNGSVFEISTGIKLFTTQLGEFSVSHAAFSPNSEFVAVENVGVYTVPDGELVFETDGWTPNFSDSGRLLGITSDGIYEVGTWEKLMDIQGDPFEPIFSKDESVVLIIYDGFYNLQTGAHLEQPVIWPYFSPDEMLIANVDDGVYATATFEKLLEMSQSKFPGNYLVFNSIQTRARLTYFNEAYGQNVNEACMIYGLPGTQWAYRSGLVHAPEPITAYSSPNGDAVTEIANELIVFSQTEGSEWYRITLGEYFKPMPDLWVKAEDVTAVSLPGGIPIEYIGDWQNNIIMLNKFYDHV